MLTGAFFFLTWDDGDGVFFPGHHADVLLDNRGDEALEDSDITPHGALVSHTDCIRLPEHWRERKIMDINQWNAENGGKSTADP